MLDLAVVLVAFLAPSTTPRGDEPPDKEAYTSVTIGVHTTLHSGRKARRLTTIAVRPVGASLAPLLSGPIAERISDGLTRSSASLEPAPQDSAQLLVTFRVGSVQVGKMFHSVSIWVRTPEGDDVWQGIAAMTSNEADPFKEDAAWLRLIELMVDLLVERYPKSHRDKLTVDISEIEP